MPQDPLSETVGNLLRTVDEFLDLLVAVHNTPLGEAYQIMDTLRLMDFLKDMRKEDMFIRYVHQLVTVQLSSNNLVEAALSLRLHADLYTWDVNERVPALSDPDFPEQTAFERREQLFLEMIGYYEDGKSWENALETYRELADNYEHIVFEYGKLSKCYRAMAKLQQAILEGSRTEPKFYRVAYYGMGFPSGLRDRQFVVQGGPWEGFQMFADRMMMQHPAARLVESAVDSVEGQFIQISPVSPEINYAAPSFRKQRVPTNVRDYLTRRGIRAFSVTHLETDAPVDTWTEKTVFITIEGFPAILKRSEVMDSVIVGVSPVERAIEEVLRRTKQLAELEQRFSEYKSPDRNLDMGAFSIALTNAVDANKSIASLRMLLEEHETKEELRESLRTVIADHVALIKKSLGTHGRLVPDGLRGVQSSCVKCFEATFRRELAEAQTPAPMLPISPGQWKQLNQNQNARYSSANRDSQMTPVPLNTATRMQEYTETHQTALGAAPPSQQLKRTLSILSDTGTEKSSTSVGHGRRLTSMIFGHHHGTNNSSVSGAQQAAAVVLFKTTPPMPLDSNTPESIYSGSVRSRSESVSTSRSRKSSQSTQGGIVQMGHSQSVDDLTEHISGGHRPKTPGRLERSVGSVRRRWSAMHLVVGNGNRGKEGRSAGSSVNGGSDFGGVREEEEDDR